VKSIKTIVNNCWVWFFNRIGVATDDQIEARLQAMTLEDSLGESGLFVGDHRPLHAQVTQIL